MHPPAGNRHAQLLGGLATPEGDCVARRDEAGERHQHAERLHVLIDAVLRETATERSALTAVAVGCGPGSFTGLRIGTSAAKGICAGLGLPLVAPSPRRLCGTLVDKPARPRPPRPPDRILPAIDARRMEVFTLDAEGQPAAAIVDGGFAGPTSGGPALLIGDGAEKCAETLASHPADWPFQAAYPSAADLIPEALERLRDGRTEDVADYEPVLPQGLRPGHSQGIRSASAPLPHDSFCRSAGLLALAFLPLSGCCRHPGRHPLRGCPGGPQPQPRRPTTTSTSQQLALHLRRKPGSHRVPLHVGRVRGAGPPRDMGRRSGMPMLRLPWTATPSRTRAAGRSGTSSTVPSSRGPTTAPLERYTTTYDSAGALHPKLTAFDQTSPRTKKPRLRPLFDSNRTGRSVAVSVALERDR